jgi:hypothetical protein
MVYYSTFGAQMAKRLADLFASPWRIFTQFNSRHNTVTNCTIINIGRHITMLYLDSICLERILREQTPAEVLGAGTGPPRSGRHRGGCLGVGDAARPLRGGGKAPSPIP